MTGVQTCALPIFLIYPYCDTFGDGPVAAMESRQESDAASTKQKHSNIDNRIVLPGVTTNT